MLLSIKEQNVVDQVEALSAAAKTEAAKALGFIHRFQWTVLVGGIIIGVILGHVLGL